MRGPMQVGTRIEPVIIEDRRRSGIGNDIEVAVNPLRRHRDKIPGLN